MANNRNRNLALTPPRTETQPSSSSKRSRSSVDYAPSRRSEPALSRSDELIIQQILNDMLYKDLLTIADISYSQHYIGSSSWVAKMFLKADETKRCQMILQARDKEDERKIKKKREGYYGW
ncbi:hypothetical protein E3N88_22848 [Mikania micrantha]|uniref:Uncharacterized protein n=1 Tax=Mikania micrantha TaxID=192012 RepID=A0A5N6NDB0_9ASTR|nr:hypothetical protein E3N88_22848 [Mikania micrantha]